MLRGPLEPLAAFDRLVAHPGRGGCGVGAVADPNGPSPEVLSWALAGLGCMEHRGGCIDQTGDGAGLLIHTPRAFFERHLAPGRHLHPAEHLAVGVLFFPPGEEGNLPPTQQEIDHVLRRQGLSPLGWRKVPVNEAVLGDGARRSRKDVWQVLIGQGMVRRSHLPLALFRVKARLEASFRDLYVASLAADTVVYKAMATGPQLLAFYPDLADPDFVTDLAVFHRRYSTNTFSNWYLAQPFRVLGHNGEINSIKAVRSAVRNLEAELGLPGLLMHQGSDSADLDRMVELLTSHGMPLLEALVRTLPAAWRDGPDAPGEMIRWQDAVRRAMGTLAAWEGPAAVVASDGSSLVGILDRMGLRPLRWVVTRGGRVILGSEIGAVPVAMDDIAETGQLEPGEAFAVDLPTGRILRPDDVASAILETTALNHRELHTRRLHPLVPTKPAPEGEAVDAPPSRTATAADRWLTLFGWDGGRTRVTGSMAKEGKEPISSMGFDRPLAVFSPQRPVMTKYFRQIIAVVTNPPIDPIREGGAMDLSVYLGRSPLISEDLPEYAVHPQYRLARPMISEAELDTVRGGGPDRPVTTVVDATYAFPEDGVGDPRAIATRIAELTEQAVGEVRRGQADVLVVSDRKAIDGLDGGRLPGRLPLPLLLLVSFLHEALTDAGLRRQASVVVETGEVQEPHDTAVLLACGADAVCPWLFLEVCRTTRGVAPAEGEANGLKALEHGLKRILSKMGTTTLEGYRGSRLFEAVGVSPTLVDYYLPGITSRIGGIGLDDLHHDALGRAAQAADADLRSVPRPSEVNVYRKEVWHTLQQVARGDDPEAWRRFRGLLADTPPVYLRDLLRLEGSGAPVTEAEVAPPEWIVATTFRGSAMSHGSLHRVAHRAIAAAFNRLGSKSNSGEGGEDPRRGRGGEWALDRSRVRQVASGRFGVDARFLVNADDLEIKIGQGAKPGEGGHLPGHKVTAEIAFIRKTREGVSLISPPPHHDIYSIEDLAQLVYNLRQIHPRAGISVKCPTVTDIGTIAVGVVKAGADVVAISGSEGGTGAAAASSIEHAGLPLERGLAEVHQALVVNGIRQGVVLRVDGGIKTGDDVVKLLALGADEVSLGTALMIAEQCTFCHGCAKGNCPAGITTQDEKVASRLMKLKGADAKKAAPQPVLALAAIQNPDDDEEMRYQDATAAVERYLLALAGDVRRTLARLGLRTPAELVGRVDLLAQAATGSARTDTVDLSELLVDPKAFEGRRIPLARMAVSALPGDREAPSPANARILEAVRAGVAETEAGTRIGPVEVDLTVGATDRAVGATLSGELAAGRLTVPEHGIHLRLEGNAGQALGFGLVDGVRLDLEGYGNDTVGEAMSGGRIVVRRPAPVPRDGGPRTGSVAGNAVGYGMTGGTLFLEGRCGQRLGVRMSEGVVVCEGAGKYAFEYMTGGVGVVLGSTGAQACSGMTGGVVYLLEVGGARERVNGDAEALALEPDDVARLEVLLGAFAETTGSRPARRLLEGWPEAASRFVKVVPKP